MTHVEQTCVSLQQEHHLFNPLSTHIMPIAIISTTRESSKHQNQRHVLLITTNADNSLNPHMMLLARKA